MMSLSEDLKSSIDQLADSRRSGWSLPRWFYLSPEVFDLELERVFAHHWLFTDHISRIPRAGDYFLFNVGDESIIVINGRDGQLHALVNVCRHRGSRICLEPSGTAKKLVCPYHSWTYETDGTLLAARHMPLDFDKTQFGLQRCEARVLEGLIFVNLAKSAPPFDRMACDVKPFLQPYDLLHTRIGHRRRYEVRANWKLVLENFVECYHCANAHPQFSSVFALVAAHDSRKIAEEYRQFTAEWEDQVRALGYKTGAIERTPDRWYQAYRIPIRRGFQTQSEEGKPVAPLLGTLAKYDGGIFALAAFPSGALIAGSDHAVLLRFTPLHALLTEVEVSWLVREDAVEGADYDIQRLTWLWQATCEQDFKLCEDNQAGVNSRHYEPGPYSEVEGVESFVQWYIDQMKQSGSSAAAKSFGQRQGPRDSW